MRPKPTARVFTQAARMEEHIDHHVLA